MASKARCAPKTLTAHSISPLSRAAEERNRKNMKLVLGTRGHRGHRRLSSSAPDQLPVYAKKLGKMLRELKKYTGAASEEIQKNVVEPLNEIQAPLKEAVAP